jgi:hypothetical protein
MKRNMQIICQSNFKVKNKNLTILDNLNNMLKNYQ